MYKILIINTICLNLSLVFCLSHCRKVQIIIDFMILCIPFIFCIILRLDKYYFLEEIIFTILFIRLQIKYKQLFKISVGSGNHQTIMINLLGRTERSISSKSRLSFTRLSISTTCSLLNIEKNFIEIHVFLL